MVQHSVFTAVSGRAGWALAVQLSTDQVGHGGPEWRSNLPEVTQQDANANHQGSHPLLSTLCLYLTDSSQPFEIGMITLRW